MDLLEEGTITMEGLIVVGVHARTLFDATCISFIASDLIDISEKKLTFSHSSQDC